MTVDVSKYEFTGKLFLIVGPSGTGKGSVIENLKRIYPGFVFPVSCTTREMREGEVEGKTYHYISKEEFETKIEVGDFLEYAIVHETNYYGTLLKEFTEPLERGACVVREVDMQGFESIRDIFPKENLVSIFIKVSDSVDLRQRILDRSPMTPDELDHRMKSFELEMAKADTCDYVVENENGKLGNTIRAVEKIILDEFKDMY